VILSVKYSKLARNADPSPKIIRVSISSTIRREVQHTGCRELRPYSLSDTSMGQQILSVSISMRINEQVLSPGVYISVVPRKHKECGGT
jgi:hypothetical protein